MPATDFAERLTGAPPSPQPSAAAPPQRTFFTRRAVLSYFILVFLFVALTAPMAPAIVGLLLTGFVAGRTGYRDLLARMLRWRVSLRWYALALLLAPLSTIAAAVLLARVLGTPEFLPAIFSTQDPLRILLPGVLGGLVAGFCEELGWTGFAIPRLRLRHSIVTTALLVGVVWGAWHFPLFREGDSFSGVFPSVLLLVQLFAWLPAYRVLMVWVYERTGSLLVAMVMHASLSASKLVLQPGPLSDALSLTSLLVWAASLWVLVAAVAMASRGRLTRDTLPAQSSGRGTLNDAHTSVG
jgi:membrane protease YdiL (CAAX protease family)